MDVLMTEIYGNDIVRIHTRIIRQDADEVWKHLTQASLCSLPSVGSFSPPPDCSKQQGCNIFGEAIRKSELKSECGLVE